MTTEDYILELRRRGLRRGEVHGNFMLDVAERMAEQVRDIERLLTERYKLKDTLTQALEALELHAQVIVRIEAE